MLAALKGANQEAGGSVLRHGPIANLRMGAITMAFPVKDRASLKDFKEGEAVSVTFDNVDGKPAVVEMRRK